MSFDPDAVEVYIRSDEIFLGAYKAVMLQVRRGPLTLSMLDKIESFVRSVRAREGGGAYVGVLEETAEVASGPVRQRQTALYKELLTHERSWAVTIVAAAGPRAALLRTMMRVVAFANPRLAIVDRPIDAGRWLETHLKVPAREIAAYIEWGRTRRGSIMPSPKSADC